MRWRPVAATVLPLLFLDRGGLACAHTRLQPAVVLADHVFSTSAEPRTRIPPSLHIRSSASIPLPSPPSRSMPGPLLSTATPKPQNVTRKNSSSVQVLGPGFGSFYGTFVPIAKAIITATAPSGGGRSSVGDSGGALSATTQSQDTDMLRGKAMEAIALMGQAVGLGVFRGDAHQVKEIDVSVRDRRASFSAKWRFSSLFSLRLFALACACSRAPAIGPNFLFVGW